MDNTKPGDKVVCIDTSGLDMQSGLCGLVTGRIYTVKDVFLFPPKVYFNHPDPGVVYSLVECPRVYEDFGEIGFGAHRFRPAQDITLFQEIANTVKDLVDA